MSVQMEEELDPVRAPLPKTPVLITAATKWEAEPLAKGLKLSPAGDGRWDGVVAGRAVVVLKTGMGAVKTADALKDVPAEHFGLAISAGLCGAMQPALKRGDLVADAQEVDMDFVVPLRETAKALALPFHFGRIQHTNVVLGPDAKRRLGAEWRAVACDMETAAVKRWAGSTPALGVRVVLDEMHEALPADAPESEDAAALARFALRNAARLPTLVGVGLRSARAMKTLTGFLEAYLEAI